MKIKCCLDYIPYLSYVMCLLAVLISLLIICYMEKIDAVKYKVDTYLKYNREDLKESEKSFKEDYYIQQQSHNTTLILTCFGIGMTIFSFLTYFGMDEKLKHTKNVLTKENESLIIKLHGLIDVQKKRLDKNNVGMLIFLRKYLMLEARVEFRSVTDRNLDGWPVEIFVQGMFSNIKGNCEAYTNSQNLIMNHDDTNSVGIVEDLIYLINKAINILYNNITDKKIKKIELPTSQDSLSAENLTVLETILSDNSKRQVYEILSKVSIKEKNI